MLVVTFAYAVVEPRGDRIVNGMFWSPEQRFLLEFGLFFFAGVVLYQFGIHASRSKALLTLALCWIAAAIAYGFDRPLLSLWLAVPVTTLLMGTASTPYLRRAGRFGDASYGLYLYAFPVQQTLIWLYKDKLSWSVLFLLVLASTLALALASWHLLEKRVLRLKPVRRGTATGVAES
jgi:peptidoglycan/LPS O-acetylase OafA/YrhL